MDDSRAVPINLPRPIRVFWILSIVLTAAFLYALWRNWQQLHLPYPYNFPFIPMNPGIDYFCFQTRFQYLHHLEFFSPAPELGVRFMYPAPVALLYEGFYLTGRHGLAIFLVMTSLFLAGLGIILARLMVRQGLRPITTWLLLVSSLLMSYPFWFEYLLGNMEICIFLLIAFGLIAYFRGHFYLMAILIAIAASMKIFPFVYLALLLTKKKYREIAVAAVVAGALNIASLWVLYPSLQVSSAGVRDGLAAFREHYMQHFLSYETGFDHSIFGFIKATTYNRDIFVTHANRLSAYLVAVTVGGILLYFFRIRHLPVLNQIFALCIASILLPPTSHDYTLIHLYVPWALLLIYTLHCAAARKPLPGIVAAFVCCAILFSSESEAIADSGISGQIKCVVLVVLFIIVLVYRWKLPEEQGESPALLSAV